MTLYKLTLCPTFILCGTLFSFTQSTLGNQPICYALVSVYVVLINVLQILTGENLLSTFLFLSSHIGLICLFSKEKCLSLQTIFARKLTNETSLQLFVIERSVIWCFERIFVVQSSVNI
jgi:hypothetical protein